MVDSDLVKDKGLTTGATPPDTADVLLPPFTPAPDLTLAAMPGQSLTLSGLAGQSVILAFYPADWSPVCGDQMALYNEVLPAFRDYGAELIGLSVDSAWCHAAFAQSRNLEFPLLADFEPKGRSRQSVSRLSRSGRLCPAGALCHRQEWSDLLELSLPRGGQSGG